MPKVKTTKKTLSSLPKKITDYPQTNNILYTDGKRNHYCVETTWGRANNKRTVRCFINYVERKPLFKILYGVNFSEEVQSNMSSIAVVNATLKKLFPNNEKSLILGVHLFGIHLETLKRARENCN
ncbi:unnamed protein product [Rhizophagus irregularis]|nr:unnamed protein product [Rhizophagus irregularis]